MLLVETKTLKLLLPYASVLLVVLGMTRLTIYYNAFNIQINNFLEFSEIITSFFNEFLYISGLFILISVFDFLSTNNRDVNNREIFHNTYVQENSLRKRMQYNLGRFAVLVWLDIFFIITYIISLLMKADTRLIVNGLIFLNLQTMLSILLLEYKRKYLQYYQKPLNPSLYNLILYFIIIYALLISRTYDDIHNVKDKKKFIHTSFVTINDTIVSDSLHYYIGQTKNFLFFYNQDKNVTTVYNINDIKKMNFGN